MPNTLKNYHSYTRLSNEFLLIFTRQDLLGMTYALFGIHVLVLKILVQLQQESY